MKHLLLNKFVQLCPDEKEDGLLLNLCKYFYCYEKEILAMACVAQLVGVVQCTKRLLALLSGFRA